MCSGLCQHGHLALEGTRKQQERLDHQFKSSGTCTALMLLILGELSFAAISNTSCTFPR